MATTILIILAVLIAGVLIFAATKPNTMRVERSQRIQARPEAIYPLIADFHRWESWSPYEKLDPDMTKSFSGAPHGEGAVYEWAGKKAGVGRMEITETTPPSQIVIDLRFEKPFKAHNSTVFAIEPDSGGSRVSWIMQGPRPYVSKLMCVFIDLDKMIGKDFESGLVAMKSVAERQGHETIPAA